MQMDENENKKEIQEEVEVKTQEQKPEENNSSKEIPKFEQLDDVEFEKEQEAKKKKNRKAKKIILIILAIILIAGIGLAVFFVVKIFQFVLTAASVIGCSIFFADSILAKSFATSCMCPLLASDIIVTAVSNFANS